MYQHLLVPIDGSPLANATVEQAVAYAGAVRARITFFHARPDYAASDRGALMHALAPDAFVSIAAGNAQAILAKAEAAARAAGVAFTSASVTSDRPHEAILDAAHAYRCDLIFMASRGRRGLKGVLHASVTQKLLQRTTLPVLVAAVESNLPYSDEQRALAIIRNEHRSLAAVVHGLQHAVSEAAKTDRAPDFALLRAMLFYIEAYPERLHHPKEDAYLFRLLRSRSVECDGLIGELEKQHVAGAASFTELRDALAAYESGSPDGAAAFAEALARFADEQWRHMSAEEQLVFPAASRHLQPADWAEIARAFGENGDPRFDADTDASFEQLFSRILNFAAGLPQRDIAY